MTNTYKTRAASFISKKDIIRLLLLALTALYCILPLFVHYGLPYSQDIIFHIFQSDQFNQAIHDGVLYPRWINGNKGYGSPNFIFYSPLSYYFVSAIRFVTQSLTSAMIIAIWCSFFFSGLTIFITIKKISGGSDNPLPAIIYQILPYHLFNIYIRGTFAELFAFIWFPLIILFIYKTIESSNRSAMIGLSISYAGLILTHLVSGFIFTFVAGAYIIYNYFPLKNKKSLIKTIFSLALGLGLSSIYLIPVIIERKFVQIEYIVTSSIGNYRENFLFTWDKFQPKLLTFYLPLHIIVVLEVIVFLVILLLIQKNRYKLSESSQKNFFIIIFLFAFLLTSPLSRPIWDIVPGFPFLQFPWRWIPIIELSLCFLISSVFTIKDKYAFRSIKLKKVFIYSLIVLSLSSFALISKSKIIPDRLVRKIANLETGQNYIISYEYTPRWVNDIRKILSQNHHEKISVVTGIASINIVEWKSEKRVIDIKATTPVLIRVSTFYYPGWVAEIEGKRTKVGIEKENGAMLIDIPEGNHTLTLKFVDTPLRLFAKLLSLASVLIMALFVFFPRRSIRS